MTPTRGDSALRSISPAEAESLKQQLALMKAELEAIKREREVPVTGLRTASPAVGAAPPAPAAEEASSSNWYGNQWSGWGGWGSWWGSGSWDRAYWQGNDWGYNSQWDSASLVNAERQRNLSPGSLALADAGTEVRGDAPSAEPRGVYYCSGPPPATGNTAAAAGSEASHTTVVGTPFYTQSSPIGGEYGMPRRIGTKVHITREGKQAPGTLRQEVSDLPESPVVHRELQESTETATPATPTSGGGGDAPPKVLIRPNPYRDVREVEKERAAAKERVVTIVNPSSPLIPEPKADNRSYKIERTRTDVYGDEYEEVLLDDGTHATSVRPIARPLLGICIVRRRGHDQSTVAGSLPPGTHP